MNSDLDGLFQELDNPNKVARKRSLEKILLCLKEDSSRDHHKVWESHHKALYKRLQDESERCREISAEIVLELLLLVRTADNQPAVDPKLFFLIPILEQRLAQPDTHEPSEEVRLTFFKVLEQVLLQDTSSESLRACLDDISRICISGLDDGFVEVKVRACACLRAWSALDFFHLSSSHKLLTALVKNFGHQQKRVRLAAVRAIGKCNKSKRERGRSKSVTLFLSFQVRC